MRYTIFLGILLWLACSRNHDDGGKLYTSSQTTPTRGDWVILFTLSDPENLNPTNSTSADAMYMLNNVFFSLLSVDPRDTTYPYVPALA
ncbi:MAG: hypothetical protein RMJ66_03820, partial [Bacteroidia bacterium]|nr:hypothetical protein [Bacteroidia bacterium]